MSPVTALPEGPPWQGYLHPSPEAVRSLLTRLGLTQAAAARLLCIDERTVRRYVSGQTIMHFPVLYTLIGRGAGIGVRPDSWRSEFPLHTSPRRPDTSDPAER